MECNITKQSVFVNEPVLNQNLEQPIDTEFTLPDYCPDIDRIITVSYTHLRAAYQCVGARCYDNRVCKLPRRVKAQGGPARVAEYERLHNRFA